MADSKTPQGGEGDKVQLDQFESSLEAESSSSKVELDLDDAPFLEWDEEEPEEEPGEEAEEEPEEAESEEASPWWRRGWWILLLAATLATLAALLYVLLCQTTTPTGSPSAEPKRKEPAIPRMASEPIRTDLKPFLVEFSNGDREDGFSYLHFGCSLYTKDRKVLAELGDRRTELREVIYDYLRRKDRPPLSDMTSMEDLKKGLLEAVNARIAAGGFGEVMIQEYVVY